MRRPQRPGWGERPPDRLEQRIVVERDGTITARSGKVEYGQGISQTALILAALGLPFLGSIFDSKDTFCPSLSELNPERSTSEIWTKTSGPPPSTTMKPKPFCALKNFTVPVAIVLALLFVTQLRYGPLLARLPATHAVRLQLHALAYNLGNFMWMLATPEPIKHWSLTSLKEKLIKIGAKLVSHGRYVGFQMAEVAVSRHLFAEILRLIAELRPPPDPAPA